MKKTILNCAIMSILATSGLVFAEESKKLTFYGDLAEYKEIKKVSPLEDGTIELDLIDTAVLDSFNIVMNKDNRELLPSSIEIHEKSEDNILKLNKDKTVFVNDKQYTLKENGEGYVKLLNDNGLTTYLPKSKIESISFVHDVSSINHIAKINLREAVDSLEIDYNYMLGMLSWKPSYKFYMKDKDTLQLDYYIEVNNQTLNKFEDIKMEVVLDSSPRLINKEYSSSSQGGIFDYYQNIRLDQNQKINPVPYKKSYSNMQAMDGAFMSMESSSSVMQKSYQAPIKRTEVGIEIFSLPNNVTLSPKSITKHLYMDTQEIEYVKENYLYEPNFNSSDLESKRSYPTYSRLNISNKEGIKYKNGVGSLYSKEKLDHSKMLLKEYHVSDGYKNKSFRFEIGKNSTLLMEPKKVEDVYKSAPLFVKQSPDHMLSLLNMAKNNTKYVRNARHIISTGIEIEKRVAYFENTGDNDNVTLNIGNNYVIKKDNISEVKELVLAYKSLPKWEQTLEEISFLKEKIEKIVSRESIKFDLKESNEIEYYKLSFLDKYIDFNDVSRSKMGSVEYAKSLKEIEKYIKNIKN